MRQLVVVLSAALVAAACESETPDATPTGSEGEGEGEGPSEGEGEGEGGAACEPPQDYYPGDAWDDCISDDGTWELAGDSTPSSAARVRAFEQIADLLWRRGTPPDANAFLQAATIYGVADGVGSRVVRRYDSHVPKPERADCKAEDAGTKWPDYCVGPAAIEPLISGALEAGVGGEEPGPNARRVEAGLAWFYYVSAYKEANTCRDTAKDCDSSWAYYSGAVQRDAEAAGFGGLVQDVELPTHGAVFDALLALRCWRDLNAGDAVLHERALAQLDAALDRGLAALLSARLRAVGEATELTRAGQWAFLEVLGPVLDRAARLRDASAADALASIWSGGAATADADAARSLLDELFPCPY